MADIDRTAFALDVWSALDRRGLSFRQACAVHPGLDPAMLSRATRGRKMSAGNMLLLCRVFGLDPFSYLVERPRLTLKIIAEQAVTRLGKRETEVRP